MQKTIKISKPYIEEGKSNIFEKSVKLCADITMENPNNNKLETKKCYYEFEEKYKEYLCVTRSDAFVMGLLSSALETGNNIEFIAPISERLYYQLTTYYIPILSKYNATYPVYPIKLIGPHNNKEIQNEKKVATGCSGGIDSFYTILKNGQNCITKEHKLTHLVYSSSGTLDNVEQRMTSTFKNTYEEVKKLATDCHLDTIGCYNNLFEFYKFPYKAFNMFYTTTFGSVAFALQKLINIYYASAGETIESINFDLTKTDGHDSSVFDIFTLFCMNTENLSFYSSGMECSRIEREEYIADYLPMKKHLMICGVKYFCKEERKHLKNCSLCSKCLRTMTDFYAFGKLDSLKDVMDINNFLKHKTKYIGKMMGQQKISYVRDMKETAKKNNIKIPFGSYIYLWCWYLPIKKLRKIFKNSLLARKIYYKFDLDYKLDGYRGEKFEVYKDKVKSKRK